MDDLSVSKGVFAHCKKYIGSSKAKTNKKQKNNVESKQYLRHKQEPWYKVYQEISLAIDNTAAGVHANTFKQLLYDLRDYVEKIKRMPLLYDEIPTGILLAGVNLPDHNLLLQKLKEELDTVTPYIATVWSRDAVTLKNLIEEIVYQIINNSEIEEEQIKKLNCNFVVLNAWYKETNNGDTPIIIILPDFESFCSSVLHDLILILSSYMTSIKFILIFGVATTLHVVHRSLSYDATSKLRCQVFKMQQQTDRLSNVLNSIIFSPDIPFKITGRALDMLVDMFLWYDFSVDGFLKSYKICLWQHFYNASEKVVCCKPVDISDNVTNLKSSDFEKIKNLPSVAQYLKEKSSKGTNISIPRLKQKIMDLLEGFHEYMDNFLMILKSLFKISDQFGQPFGKSFREIYVSAVGKHDFCESSEYKRAIQLISFFSKEELLSNINTIINILDEKAPEDVKNGLMHHHEVLIKVNTNEIIEEQHQQDISMTGFTKRSQFKESLKQNTKIVTQSAYKKARADFIKFLDEEVFRKYLRHPSKVPIHEVFCFSDVTTVNRNVKGSTKASIYTSLNDFHFAFGGTCCTENMENISEHPDIYIVYKLHLENRKMINMYDWLQAFICIVDPNRYDNEEIDPVLQARFTRAVAELQFLGFIKATRRKTDHVKRLTV